MPTKPTEKEIHQLKKQNKKSVILSDGCEDD